MNPRAAYTAIIVGVLLFVAALFSVTCRILLLGWIAFLLQTIPQATINPTGVASGLVAIGLLVVLSHWFCRGLVRAVPTASGAPPRTWRFRWTLYLVVAVVIMFVVGYSTIALARHLGWVFSSTAPIL